MKKKPPAPASALDDRQGAATSPLAPTLDQLRTEHAAAVVRLVELKAATPRSLDATTAQKLTIQALADAISRAE